MPTHDFFKPKKLSSKVQYLTFRGHIRSKSFSLKCTFYHSLLGNPRLNAAILSSGKIQTMAQDVS